MTVATIITDAGENIRALTDELSEMVDGPALAKVTAINDLLLSVAQETGYQFLDTPDEAA